MARNKKINDQINDIKIETNNIKNTIKDGTKNIKDSFSSVKPKRKLSENIKLMFVRLFYTFVAVLFIYFVILFCTMYIPDILAFVLGGLGFSNDNANLAQLMTITMAGLFLTGWIFLISFVAIKFVWKTYVAKMRSTFFDSTNAKLDKVFRK